MSAGFDALDAVRAAVAIVCQVEPGPLAASTRFDSLGADSLARISIADLVEARVAAAGGELFLDDAGLCRMASLGDLVTDIESRLAIHDGVAVAS